MYWLHTSTAPLFSDLGTDGARKTENVLEKMIYKWGQISIHDNLSPLVFDVWQQSCTRRPRTPRVFVRIPGPVETHCRTLTSRPCAAND